MTEHPATKIIQAVRELLSDFPMPGENAGQQDGTERRDQKAQLITTDLTENPTGQAQYQSLTMLAALVRWFSRESGRTEAEFLDGLAANATNL